MGINVAPEQARAARARPCSPTPPAKHAGLGPGDVVVAVNGTTLAGRSTEFASGLIQGKEGTKVTLTVVSKRPPQDGALDP